MSTKLGRRTMLAVMGGALCATRGLWRAAPARAADRYPSNTALYADSALVEGVDYGRRFRRHGAIGDASVVSSTFPDTVVLATHGGGIEPGTSELCLAVAGFHPASFFVTPGQLTYDYWMFEGLRASSNAELHITSTNCDDPVALSLCAGARRIISVHGCAPGQLRLPEGGQAVLVGGRDTALKARLARAYLDAEIQALTGDAGQLDLDGSDPHNIVNRGLTGAGLQLDLTTPLRAAMFDTNTRAQRKNSTTELFWRFVNTTRKVLELSRE